MIGSIGLLEQFSYFCLDLCLQFVGMFVAECFVLGGISLDLGPVQADSSELQYIHFMGDHQNLYEQPFEFRQKSPPEAGNCIVIGVTVGSNVAECYRVVCAVFQLAT